MSDDTRLPHLVYRCRQCTRLLTRREIYARWLEFDSGAANTGLCPCGGAKISPSNLTLWEEITTPRVWVLWWKEVVLPRLGF